MHMYGIEYTPMVEEWVDTCPHGYVEHHERETCPGFRDHDMWTDCPWCNMKSRYRGYAHSAAHSGDTAFNIIFKTACEHGERKPCGAMKDRMKSDKDIMAWFGYQGILRGAWTPEMHIVWNNWLSRRFF